MLKEKCLFLLVNRRVRYEVAWGWIVHKGRCGVGLHLILLSAGESALGTRRYHISSVHSPVSYKGRWKDGALSPRDPAAPDTVSPRQSAHAKSHSHILEETNERGAHLTAAESRVVWRKVEIFFPAMNFDELLSAIGGFGRYQKILYIWICLPQVLLAMHMMVSIFTGATPPHQCRGDSGNQSLFPGTENLNFSLSGSSCSSTNASLRGVLTERVPCAHGWVYGRDTFQSTTVTEVRAWWRPQLFIFSIHLPWRRY